MRLIDADALMETLGDFLARNYEPIYDLDDIGAMEWPVKHEQQKAAWMKVLRKVIEAEQAIDAIPVEWMLQRMNETASGAGLDVDLNNALFRVGVEWERSRMDKEAST